MDNKYHILFEIRGANKEILASNLAADFIVPLSMPTVIRTDVNPITKKQIRHGYFVEPEYSIYVASDSKNITNKILNHFVLSANFFAKQIIEIERNIKNRESQNFRRLRHNIVTHNTNILQELEKTFPLEASTKGSTQQNNFIKDIILKNPNDCAITILKVIKSANLIKSDFDVYDMLLSKRPLLEFDKHSIHRVVTLVIKPFWLDFFEKEIKISMTECHEKVNIDYKSISVVLSHIFDNAIKYIAPKTELKLSFSVHDTAINISFEMISLKLTDIDLDKIFDEGYSGQYATGIGKSGDGIGMSVVKKLLSMNKGDILIEKDIDSKSRISLLGIPFEKNRFTITLPK